MECQEGGEQGVFSGHVYSAPDGRGVPPELEQGSMVHHTRVWAHRVRDTLASWRVGR